MFLRLLLQSKDRTKESFLTRSMRASLAFVLMRNWIAIQKTAYITSAESILNRDHIKPRPNVFWSVTNKHPYLIRQGSDLDLRTDYTMTWPSQQRAVAAHANKPFDRNFTYFEVIVLSSWGEAGESDGYVLAAQSDHIMVY